MGLGAVMSTDISCVEISSDGRLVVYGSGSKVIICAFLESELGV